MLTIFDCPGSYGVMLHPIGGSIGGSVGGSVGGSKSPPTLPNGKPLCTVQGGPATLLYFPPRGQQGSLDSANKGANGPAPPSPAGGEAYTTLGQTFQPGQVSILNRCSSREIPADFRYRPISPAKLSGQATRMNMGVSPRLDLPLPTRSSQCLRIRSLHSVSRMSRRRLLLEYLLEQLLGQVEQA